MLLSLCVSESLFGLCLWLSISLSLCVSVRLCLSLWLSITVSLPLSVCVYVALCVKVCRCVSECLSCVCLRVYGCVSEDLSLCVCVSEVWPVWGIEALNSTQNRPPVVCPRFMKKKLISLTGNFYTTIIINLMTLN